MPAEFQLSSEPTKLIKVYGTREPKFLRSRFRIDVFTKATKNWVMVQEYTDWPTAWDELSRQGIKGALIEGVLRAALKDERADVWV